MKNQSSLALAALISNAALAQDSCNQTISGHRVDSLPYFGTQSKHWTAELLSSIRGGTDDNNSFPCMYAGNLPTS